MGIVFAGLMCHAPIVVPAVGGREARRCTGTTRAMHDVAARVVAARPDRLVLISPHTPRHRRAWSARAGPHHGDLGQFRAPEVRIDLPDAPEVAAALRLPPTAVGEALDHGAAVPLHFLVAEGWRGPTAILALPWEEHGAEEIGRALRDLPGRTAVIASGDMSHRLIPGAPAGHHPDAPRFDAAFVDALVADDWPRAVGAPYRDVAAEDVVTTTAVALAAAGAPLNAEVLHYEGPWGVGYCEAVFYEPEPPLWAVARAAVDAAVSGHRPRVPEAGPGPAGVFVTLHRDGELRGCIGHITPTKRRVFDEIAAVAPLSAKHDPRFPPVTPDEMPDLDVEVSVLEPAEPCTEAELDPRRYGVIVESDDGRRGLLLPDLDGIDDVATQVGIARRKAGIALGEPVRLSRFRVTKHARPTVA